MIRSLVNMTPAEEFRTMEEVFERLFGATPRNEPTSSVLPIDVLENNGNFIVKAAVPGVAPENLEISIENQVLTIKGENKHESYEGDVKVYRRETTYGAFVRSLRLPKNLNLEQVDASFRNGFVTITIPKLEEVKPAPLRIPVRTMENVPTKNETVEA